MPLQGTHPYLPSPQSPSLADGYLTIPSNTYLSVPIFTIANVIETEGRPAVKVHVESSSRADEKKTAKCLGQIQAFSLAKFTPMRLYVMINCSHDHGLIWDTTVTPHGLGQVSN